MTPRQEKKRRQADERELERTRELQRLVDDGERARQADHERAARLQLIADIGQRTTAILSPAALLPSALQVIRESFQYFMVNLFLVDGDDIVCRASTMPELAPCIGTLRLRIGRQGITGWVAARGVPLNVPDVRQDPRYRYELEEERRTRSELAVPIVLKGVVTGVLDVQSEKEGAFTDLDVFTLQTVAGQLAVAVENARLYDALQKELAVRRRTEKLLRVLNDAGLAMQKAASPDAVLVTVGEELEEAGFLCALHLMGEDGRLTRAYSSPRLLKTDIHGARGGAEPGLQITRAGTRRAHALRRRNDHRAAPFRGPFTRIPHRPFSRAERRRRAGHPGLRK